MTEDNRKEQEKKEELTEKDLEKASGGAPRPVQGSPDIVEKKKR